MSTPQLAFRNCTCDVSESMVCRSSAREEPGRITPLTVTQALSANSATTMPGTHKMRRGGILYTMVVRPRCGGGVGGGAPHRVSAPPPRGFVDRARVARRGDAA